MPKLDVAKIVLELAGKCTQILTDQLGAQTEIGEEDGDFISVEVNINGLSAQLKPKWNVTVSSDDDSDDDE